MALLALIAGQDVEWIDDPNAPGSRWWQIARQVAHDRVISTVDPDTRHAHKTRERRHDGFKAHVVAEPDTGIITAVSLTKATGPGTGDAAAGAALLATTTRRFHRQDPDREVRDCLRQLLFPGFVHQTARNSAVCQRRKGNLKPATAASGAARVPGRSPMSPGRAHRAPQP